MSNETAKFLREVKAEDLIRELVQTTDSALLSVNNVKVVGKLDLKHAIIKKPVEIRDSELEGEVDLRYCEFEQAVDFSGCTFHQEFNSGDGVEAHTVYKKDLICNKTVFKSAARFNGVRVESSAYFNEAHFLSEEDPVDFTMALIEKTIECRRAIFEGPTVYLASKCNGFGLFDEACFKGSRGPDFSFSSFALGLICTGATFEGNTNFSHASFGTGLQCSRATFKGGASFASLKCGGSGDFNLAEFQGQKEINFQYASFGEDLCCQGASFQGSVTFHRLKCGGDGRFDSVDDVAFKCRGPVIFTKASIGANLLCGQAIFGVHARFNDVACSDLSCAHATFKGSVTFKALKCSDLLCNDAIFERGARFLSLKCDGNGIFTNAKFRSKEEVTFTLGSFNDELMYSGATFEGRASFDLLQCGSLHCYDAIFEESASFGRISCDGPGMFSHTVFKGEVTFGDASFSGQLHYKEATFEEEAFFGGLECEQGSFNGAKFYNDEVRFIFASFSQDLQCRETQFEGSVSFVGLKCGNLYCHEANFKGSTNFDRLRCEGDAKFADARFGTEGVNFRSTYFGNQLNLERAQVEGPVDLSTSRILQNLVLTGAQFQQKVTLYDASIGVLMLDSEVFPFRQGTLDLRECTFSKFWGPEGKLEERAMEFTNAQDPTTFTRDPYLQLEKYYESVNKDSLARRAYYQGRLALRENAKKQNGSAKWTLSNNFTDWLLKWLTGYGVRTWRLLVPIFFFIVLGMVVFWPHGALRPEASNGLMQHLFDRFAFSTARFLPVVNLYTADKWQPNSLWRQVYVFFHSLFGWILVPLLIASFAGIVRRQ